MRFVSTLYAAVPLVLLLCAPAFAQSDAPDCNSDTGNVKSFTLCPPKPPSGPTMEKSEGIINNTVLDGEFQLDRESFLLGLRQDTSCWARMQIEGNHTIITTNGGTTLNYNRYIDVLVDRPDETMEEIDSACPQQIVYVLYQHAMALAEVEEVSLSSGYDGVILRCRSPQCATYKTVQHVDDRPGGTSYDEVTFSDRGDDIFIQLPVGADANKAETLLKGMKHIVALARFSAGSKKGPFD